MVFEKKPADVTAVTNELIRRINDNIRRIRTMEQRIDITESRVESLEETILEKIGELKNSFDRIEVDIKSLAERLSKIETKLLRLDKELAKTAKKTELSKLENLIEIYSPIKSSFVTREEVERLISQKKET